MTTTRSITMTATFLLIFFSAFSIAFKAQAAGQRFFHAGDGTIRLVSEKNGRAFEGPYWLADGGYDSNALEAIHQVFDAPYDPASPAIALRLIALLDYLEDRLRPGAMITVTSGYRSPEYNTRVRDRGGLAAKASLHQYGMAADVVLGDVPSEKVWQTMKALECGGAGYYHGRTVHVDVGPARCWDETTSGVGTGISDDNKLIDLVSDYDYYRPGDRLVMRFTRMTAFPIGVAPVFLLERRESGTLPGEGMPFEPAFAIPVTDGCPRFDDIGQMADVRWTLPSDLPPGRYAVRARFCGPEWNGMPPEVATPVFEVTGR